MRTMVRSRTGLGGGLIALLVALAVAVMGVWMATLGVGMWAVADRVMTPGIVPRVLFAETAGCSGRERELVAGVMKNRVGHEGFGGRGSVEAVAAQPGAFSCVGDSANRNWAKSRRPGRMTAAERAVWEACEEVSAREVPAALGPSGRALVYYHDKSIGKPPSWDRGEWRAVREVETERFVFYSVVRANGRG